MGHLRLGRLPKTFRWQALVNLLDEQPSDTERVASLTLAAAEQELRRLAADEGLGFCVWLLTRVTWAARSADFAAALGDLGLPVRNDTSTLSFIATLSAAVRDHLREADTTRALDDLAALSLRKTLTDTIGTQPSGLFGSSVDDIRLAFQPYSTKARFGELAKQFFGDFLARTLRYCLDRELQNHVGPRQQISSVAESQEFASSVDVYARQSARILEDFAGGWYSRHNWEAQGQITPDEAHRFAAFALRKLRMEIKREATA